MKYVKLKFTEIEQLMAQDSDPWKTGNKLDDPCVCSSLLTGVRIQGAVEGSTTDVEPCNHRNLWRNRAEPEKLGRLEFASQSIIREELKRIAEGSTGVRSCGQINEWIRGSPPRLKKELSLKPTEVQEEFVFLNNKEKNVD